MRRAALTFVAFLIASYGSSPALAQLWWSVDEQGGVYLRSDEPVFVSGVSFFAPGPYLSGGQTADPFAFFLTGFQQTATSQVGLANLSSEDIVNGSLALDIQADPDFLLEVDAKWGDFESWPQTLGLLSDAPPPTYDLLASWPTEGGPLTVSTRQPLTIRQLNLHVRGSHEGLFSTTTNAAPFDRVQQGLNRQGLRNATFSNDENITIDGSLTLNLMVAAEAKPNNLFGNWYNDQFEAGVIQFVPEPNANATFLGVAMLVLFRHQSQGRGG